MNKYSEKDINNFFKNIDIGNIVSATFYINDKIENKEVLYSGEVFSLEVIKQLYLKYLKWHKSKYHKTDPQYIPTKEKKRCLYDFMIEQMYNTTFNIEEQPRDYYLFGNTPKDELIQKTKDFIENARRKQPKSQT